MFTKTPLGLLAHHAPGRRTTYLDFLVQVDDTLDDALAHHHGAVLVCSHIAQPHQIYSSLSPLARAGGLTVCADDDEGL